MIQIADQTATRPTSGTSSHTSRPRRLGRVLAGCLVVEALFAAVAVAAGVIAWPNGAGPPSNPTAVGAESAVDADDGHADDIDGFLQAWKRSLETDYATTGTLTRTALSDDTLYSSVWPDAELDPDAGSTSVWTYRHTTANGRRLTQIGDVAMLTHPTGGRRTCLRQSEGFACSTNNDAEIVDGLDDDIATLAAVEQAVRGPLATHRLVAIDATGIQNDFPRLPAEVDCWETRSLTDGLRQRWGRRAQFCFKPSSGIPVFQRILGSTRLEVTVVDIVSTTVGPDDLEPR